MTATASEDDDGESSVKNLFLPLHFSAASPVSQNQWGNLTSRFLDGHFARDSWGWRRCPSVYPKKSPRSWALSCPPREEWPPNYPNPEDGFLRSVNPLSRSASIRSSEQMCIS